MMKISAGILTIYKEKALLAHSTRSPWWRSYTPPKGEVMEGENLRQAASRETREEIGILIDPDILKDCMTIDYDNDGEIYKRVHVFIHRIKTLEEIGLKSEMLPFNMLQLEEVDDARFFNAEEIKKRALPRYIDHILPLLNTNL